MIILKPLFVFFFLFGSSGAYVTVIFEGFVDKEGVGTEAAQILRA